MAKEFRVLLFRITESYRYDMSMQEIYECTRGVWLVSGEDQTADYALSVFHKKFVGAFKINQWHKAFTTMAEYKTRKFPSIPDNWEKRHEFSGEVANKILENCQKYLGENLSESNFIDSQKHPNPVKLIYIEDIENEQPRNIRI